MSKYTEEQLRLMAGEVLMSPVNIHLVQRLMLITGHDSHYIKQRIIMYLNEIPHPTDVNH